jgi:transporter family-2 protein
MYKNLTVFNGMLLAVMIFFNGMISSKVGPIVGTLIFHVLGLILVFAISIFKKNKLPKLKKVSRISYLPGMMSVITILLNNLCIPQLGVTLTVGISLFGQLVISGLIGHWGLFGMPVYRFRKVKILGFSMISGGILIMMLL